MVDLSTKEIPHGPHSSHESQLELKTNPFEPCNTSLGKVVVGLLTYQRDFLVFTVLGNDEIGRSGYGTFIISFFLLSVKCLLLRMP